MSEFSYSIFEIADGIIGLKMPDIFTSIKTGQDSLISPEDENKTKQESPEVAPVEISSDVPETETERARYSGHTHNKFSSFCLYPEDVDFETKDKDERIVLLLRRHPVTNVKWILITIALLAGPTILSILNVLSFLPAGYPFIVNMVWYMFTASFAIGNFLNWYFNVYFITDERIVDVDFYNLINKKVSDAEIEKIQDVSYLTGGVLRTMLNFGDVIIQTAAEVSEFDFNDVPSPEKVVRILNDLMEKK